MFDRDTEYQMYADAAKREKELKSTITRQNAKDIAILFIYLMTNKRKFINYKEPYRSDRKERVLKWLGVNEEELTLNLNIEEIRIRLSKDYSFFKKMSGMFGYCCLSGDDTSMFQKFIYKGEYKTIIKYQK